MKRITQIAWAVFLGCAGTAYAQPSTCSDRVTYVASKNIGQVGNFHLKVGEQEKAAQTYHYSGPGKIDRVRVYGTTATTGGVPLRIQVFSIDANGRPKLEISSVDAIFWSTDNTQGYISVNLPLGGTYVEDDFAVGVTVLNAWPWGSEFQLSYTGDGEGLSEDLASIAGTSTGNNWTSAMTTFNKNGDFYLVPEMSHYLNALINAETRCLEVSEALLFENQSAFTKDSMFNRISMSDYSGSNFLYTWNFDDGTAVSHSMSPSHSFTAAGTYDVTLTVTVEGWQGTCTNTHTFPVSVGLNAGVSNILNVGCNGATTGSITGSVTGGSSPYQYSLNGIQFQSLNVFNNLSAGSGTLTVRDALGCISAEAYLITQPAALGFSSLTSTNANCSSNDGSILAIGQGGSGSLLYKLDGGTFQSSGNFTGLSSGSYVVTIKDANACLKQENIVVNNFGSPVLTLLSKTNISCNGSSDGSIQLAASGGTGAHQFSINGGTTYQTSGTFTGLPAGSYSVLVKDAAGCKQGFVVKLNEALPLDFDASFLAPSCANSTDAFLTVHSATGGIGSFSYSVDGINYQSSPEFSSLSSGTYLVHVKDAAGCEKDIQFTIPSTPAVVATTTSTAATCNGLSDGMVLVNSNGGTAPYTYSLNGTTYQANALFGGLTSGAYTVTVRDAHNCTVQVPVIVGQPGIIQASTSATTATCGVNNGAIIAVASGGSGSGYQYSLDGTSFNTSGSFNGLSAGTYIITVRDGSMCKRNFTESVADADGPIIQTLNSTDVGCHDGNDGSITVSSVSGGTGTLTYSLNAQNWNSSNQFVNLTAGSYTVFVKDVNGCIGTSSALLIQPDAFIITKTSTDVSCHGGTNGSAIIFAAGGSGTLAYSIDNGDTYQSSNTFSGLMAGIYKVTVRDIASCTGTIIFSINEPESILFTTGVLNVSCHGDQNGSISVNASGGVGNYTYSLGGLTYQSSSVFNGLSGAMYPVYVKDGNNCAAVHFVYVYEPDSLQLEASIYNVACAGGNNGAIDVTVVGGAGNNSYLWSTDDEVQDLQDLSAGEYLLQVMDQNGCEALQSFTVTEPEMPLVINAVVTSTNTNTGQIDATVTGGTSPYNYEWSEGSLTEDIDGLIPGIYVLTVTDASGCVSSGQFTVQNSLSVAESNVDNELLVFPNPTNNKVVLNWNSNNIVKYELLDLQGKVLLSSPNQTSKVEVDLSTMGSGVYLVRVYNSQAQSVLTRVQKID
ncbi:MAG: T9SS type A sorting domain-containing protein [Cryomorphaceae bacterium]|nr:T9SS type A sorting domain-containing protein [Cryomorphaceae bacterium]